MKIDPIFGLPVPMVFAHRGGAGENAESTASAFQKALVDGADILELDISLSKDNTIVVWHGPELDLLWRKGGKAYTKDIQKYAWSALREGYVRKPGESQPPEDPSRKLLTLQQFLQQLPAWEAKVGRPGVPLNIELKGKKKHWMPIFAHLFRLLDPVTAQRPVVLAAAGSKLLRTIRKMDRAFSTDVIYPTNLSWKEQLAYRELMGLEGLNALIIGIVDALVPDKKKKNLKAYAFETSYRFITAELVGEVHRAQGGIYPFLTGFGPTLKPLVEPGMRDEDVRKALFALLDLGVDGVMTDYPARIVPMVKAWKERQK